MEDRELVQHISETFRAPDSEQSKEAEQKLKEVRKSLAYSPENAEGVDHFYRILALMQRTDMPEIGKCLFLIF